MEIAFISGESFGEWRDSDNFTLMYYTEMHYSVKSCAFICIRVFKL